MRAQRRARTPSTSLKTLPTVAALPDTTRSGRGKKIRTEKVNVIAGKKGKGSGGMGLAWVHSIGRPISNGKARVRAGGRGKGGGVGVGIGSIRKRLSHPPETKQHARWGFQTSSGSKYWQQPQAVLLVCPAHRQRCTKKNRSSGKCLLPF